MSPSDGRRRDTRDEMRRHANKGPSTQTSVASTGAHRLSYRRGQCLRPLRKCSSSPRSLGRGRSGPACGNSRAQALESTGSHSSRTGPLMISDSWRSLLAAALVWAIGAGMVLFGTWLAAEFADLGRRLLVRVAPRAGRVVAAVRERIDPRFPLRDCGCTCSGWRASRNSRPARDRQASVSIRCSRSRPLSWEEIKGASMCLTTAAGLDVRYPIGATDHAAAR